MTAPDHPDAEPDAEAPSPLARMPFRYAKPHVVEIDGIIDQLLREVAPHLDEGERAPIKARVRRQLASPLCMHLRELRDDAILTIAQLSAGNEW